MGDTDVSEREIFKYHDGVRDRYGDPFVIARKLKTNQHGDLAALEAMAGEMQEPETTQFVQVLREAFGIPPWNDLDGEGLTDWNVMDVFQRFGDYIEGLKKNTSPGPISSPPTDSESSVSLEPQNDVTSAPSGCGCVQQESKFADEKL